MAGTYSPWLVLVSILVAVFVSYTALNLSARVAREKELSRGNLWLAGGALAMGCGIWSMHFIGMLAFSLPIPLAYDISMTLGSLVIAVAISGFALSVASNPEISLGHLSGAALIMGIGISAMHYTGMAGILILPMITYEPGLLLVSIAIAIVASFAALWLFFKLRHGRTLGMHMARVGAAFVMGFAISGMHYTAMAASRFSARSFCTTASSVDTHWLAITVTVVAIGVLSTATALLVRNGQGEAEAA